MTVSISRRWGAAAVLVAVSVTTASSATAAVATPKATTTVTKTVTLKKAPNSTALRIAVAHSTVTAKGKYQDTITGTLTAAKRPLSGERLLLQDRQVGTSKWYAAGPAKLTGKKGSVSFVVTQFSAREQYEVVFAAQSGYAASRSAIVEILKK